MGGPAGKDTFAFGASACDDDHTSEVLPVRPGPGRVVAASRAAALRPAPARSDRPVALLENVPPWLHGTIERSDSVPAGGSLTVPVKRSGGQSFAVLDHDGNEHFRISVRDGVVYVRGGSAKDFAPLDAPIEALGGFSLSPEGDDFTLSTTQEEAVLCHLRPDTVTVSAPAFTGAARTVVPQGSVASDGTEAAFFGEVGASPAPAADRSPKEPDPVQRAAAFAGRMWALLQRY